ncbi:MAG: hypothetical protein ACD_78C00352G0005 [uncultured bacterium (gcode 4)]|uniref:Uncharacterized protein n=1 Tax=uncultured bacterium (gcode 4) TaxID=1234023 RepID=K1YB41_9BACT|nr:MAG: hypothetical protein ACD_78C00352G0005 [uncultured bacterium (gcode 4)]
MDDKKPIPNVRNRFFYFLMLSFFQFKNNVFSEFLVVLSKFELFSSCEISLLYIGDVSHDSWFRRDARHVCSFSFCHSRKY